MRELKTLIKTTFKVIALVENQLPAHNHLWLKPKTIDMRKKISDGAIHNGRRQNNLIPWNGWFEAGLSGSLGLRSEAVARRFGHNKLQLTSSLSTYLSAIQNKDLN